MNILDALILGIFQGITEFLPISSSGHLVLVEGLMNLPVEDLLAFDVAVHFGTLLSIFIFFRKDFGELIFSFFRIIKTFFLQTKNHKKQQTIKHDEKTAKDGTLILGLIIATVPAVIAGLLFADFLEESLRSHTAVAVMMIITAVYFLIAEKIGSNRQLKTFGLKAMMIIGTAQAFALAPGISRSGTTIATGIGLGMERTEAARFSFLLGSIAISAATLLSLYKVTKGEFLLPPADILAIGIGSSFLSGLAAIALLMRFLKRHSLSWFSAYLIFAGIILLIM